jgi:hypothetical protein
MPMLESMSEVARFMVENGTWGVCIGTILLRLIGDFHSGSNHDMVDESSKSSYMEFSLVISSVTVLIFVWHSYSIHAGRRLLINASDWTKEDEVSPCDRHSGDECEGCLNILKVCQKSAINSIIKSDPKFVVVGCKLSSEVDGEINISTSRFRNVKTKTVGIGFFLRVEWHKRPRVGLLEELIPDCWPFIRSNMNF